MASSTTTKAPATVITLAATVLAAISAAGLVIGKVVKTSKPKITDGDTIAEQIVKAYRLARNEYALTATEREWAAKIDQKLAGKKAAEVEAAKLEKQAYDFMTIIGTAEVASLNDGVAESKKKKSFARGLWNFSLKADTKAAALAIEDVDTAVKFVTKHFPSAIITKPTVNVAAIMADPEAVKKLAGMKPEVLAKSGLTFTPASSVDKAYIKYTTDEAPVQ